MKTLRTSGIEQLEPRAMLAAFGPPGGMHDLHFAPAPRYADFGHEPAIFRGGASGGVGYDYRPPAPASQFVIQIIFVPAPVVPAPIVVAQPSGAAHSSPSLPTVLQTGISPENRGEGEAVSLPPPSTVVQSPPARTTAIGLPVDVLSLSSLPWSTTRATDPTAEPNRELSSTVHSARTPTSDFERKPLTLIQRSTATPADEGEDFVELTAVPSRTKRKSAAGEAASSEDQRRAGRVADSVRGELPRERYARILAAEQPGSAQISDDGLIELLAADIGVVQANAGPPAVAAEPIPVPQAAAPVLEIATAADAGQDSSGPAASEESPPAVPLN